MTAPAHESRFDDLLPAYALGALDGDELRDLAAHLEAGCAVCEAELRRLAAVMEALAVAAGEPEEGVQAPAGGAPLAATAPPPPVLFAPRRAAARWPLLAAAAALLALVAAWGLVRQAALGSEIERLRGERAQLAARAGALERRVAAAETESARLARTLAIAAAPRASTVSLAAMGSSHAGGRAWVDAASRRAVFYASDLPPLPPGKTYQLWYIDSDDNNVSAGVFGVDPQGKAALVMDRPLPVESIQGWAVTIEPRGGRPRPTGPMVLAG